MTQRPVVSFGKVSEAADRWIPQRAAALQALRGMPLCRELTSCRVKVARSEALEAWFASAQPLPQGAAPRVDAALDTLEIVGGIGLKSACSIIDNQEPPFRSVARRSEDRLEFLLSPRLLESSRGPALLCQLALAAYEALQRDASLFRFLMARDAPLPLQLRLAALDYMRLHDYAAACFAFHCVRRPDLVAQVCYLHRRGLNAGRAGLDLRQMAVALLGSGGIPAARLVADSQKAHPYSPTLPLVLELFQNTAVFRADDDGGEGLSLDAFAAKALEIDRRMHPAWEAAPADQRAFVTLFTHLAARLVLEASGPFTSERRQQVMEFLETGRAALESAAAQVGGSLDAELDAGHQLGWLVSGPRADWANLHCVQVLADCWQLASLEGVIPPAGGPAGLPEETIAAFRRLAGLCRLHPIELDWVLGYAARESRTASADAYRV